MAKFGTRNQAECSLAQEIRKFQYFRKKFHQLLGDTQKALKDVAHLNLIPLESSILDSITQKQIIAQRPAVIVVLGPARGRLVNFLLGEKLLPPQSNISSKLSGWRWLRLQHGMRRQIRVNFGPDFEIVDPNLVSNSDWDRIPTQNLKRDNRMDLSTIMEIELCNPFLENGVQILIPPDIGNHAFDNKSSYDSFLNDYELFYSKRDKFLENIYPLILYALDDIEPLTIKTNRDNSKMSDDNKNSTFDTSRNEKLHNDNTKSKSSAKFYVDLENNSFSSLNSSDSVGIMFEAHKNNSEQNLEDDKYANWAESSQTTFVDHGFNEDSIHDLQQVHELHPNAEVLIVFLSNVINEDKSSPIINTMHYDMSEQASDTSSNLYSSDSPELFHMSPDNSVKNQTPNKMDNNLNSRDSKSIDDYKDACSVNDNSHIKFVSEEERQEMLEKQKNFLTMLIEQLKQLSNPVMENSFIGHWLIVDEYRRNFRNPFSDVNYSKKNNIDFNVVIQKSEFSNKLTLFVKNCLQKYMLRDCTDLSEMHNTLLEQFILTSFDMAREMQIIPRKINYAAKMEQELFDSFNKKLGDGENREKFLEIINNVLQKMKNIINNTNTNDLQSSYNSAYTGTSTSIFYSNVVVESPVSTEDGSSNKDYRSVDDSSLKSEEPIETNSNNIDTSDYCIIDLPPKNSSVTEGIEAAENPCTSTSRYNIDDRNNPAFSDNEGASLDYSIFDILCNSQESVSVKERRNSQTSFKQASLEVQRTILATLSGNISIKLVKFMNFLRDDYYGTLQRCLASLEEGRREPIASEAVKQILLVTKNVDLQNCASFSFLQALVDHLRRFFNRLSLSSHSNESSVIHSPRWRQQIALKTIESLNASKLAKLITTQLRDKIRLSHEKFQSALHSLSEYHAARLQQTEELKLMVRKSHAPRFARLCLESTSLADSARYGLPRLGKELGRGQYGVVYSVKGRWGPYEPCAVKSVVPPDKRHFNELAMEFYHTRSLPSHDRIVNLYGSVIDYSYGGGNPAVLLVSERLKWDLLCALQQAKLSYKQRMQISVDIVEGIRYLHSRGLVHRDIKLKNVLLDELHRAKLTDLGFCIPEAMMSGSIVGTPIHMAPELLIGTYDNSVDVYAFGILFWYVCAGDTHLPSAFEIFQNKEQLWINVKKGLRPERLDNFSDVCWSLMERCWAADPAQRPFLGDVEPLLKEIRDNPELHYT